MSFEYAKEHYYIFIFIIVVLFIILFKSRHPFLLHSNLPVVKKYEIWRRFQSSQTIVNQFNYTSKYYNYTVTTNEIVAESHSFSTSAEFIKKYFMSSYQQTNYTYAPTENYLYTLHISNSFESYFNNTNGIVSRLYSRALIFNIRNGEYIEKHFIQFNDFLCTMPEYRKKNITPQLIYSHMTNVCNRNIKESIQSTYKTYNKVFIAKYENVSLPLLPLVSYQSYIYNISDWNNVLEISDIDPIKITRINKSNFRLFSNYMDKISKSKIFDIILCERLDKLCTMIEEDIIYVFVLHHIDNVFAAYIFNDVFMTHKDMKMIEFQGSIKNSACDLKLFYHVFFHILQELKSFEYNILIFENISHNELIQKEINKDLTFEYSIPVSYHVVNYIHKQYDPNDVLCVL